MDRALTVIPRVGDFVPAGAPLISVHAAPGSAGGSQDRPGEIGDGCRREARRGLSFDRERTLVQDVAFGLRQLVDIAERALSPAVNDPTTASQSVDQIHDILRRLLARPDPDGFHEGRDGRLRLVIHEYSFADCLDFTVGELWRYGAGAAQIPQRLAAMLDDLRTVASDDRVAVVSQWLERVREEGRATSQ